MLHSTHWLAIFGVTTALTLAGCDGGGVDAEDAGHEGDHAHADDAGQTTPAASSDADATVISPGRLGSVEIAGIVLAVELVEAFEPGGEAHFDIARTAGPAPTSLRLWIGGESGDGVMRSRADGHDDHYHAHVESPAELGPDVAVWLEVELPDGTRHRGSVELD